MKIIFTYLLSLLFILSWSNEVIALRVTSSMIKNYAVTNKKIKNSAVTHQKIKNYAVTNRKIKNYAVSSSKIANLAVTPGKIGFYSNVIIVAPSGGDFTSPRDAVNAITDATSTNPYLVKIMPGIYDIGTSALVMKEYVDIEGSGEAVTRIKGSVEAYNTSGTGVIEGASNAELRFLTVENIISLGVDVRAIYNENASPMLSNVTAVVTAGANMYGIYNHATSTVPIIRNSTVSLSGGGYSYGIFNSHASPTIENVAITLTGGETSVGVFSQTGGTTTMRNVSVAVSAGTEIRYGVYLDNVGGAIMNTVSIDVFGGTLVEGISINSSDATLMNVDVSSAGGSTHSYGIRSDSGMVEIHHSSIEGAVNSVNTISGNTYIGNTYLLGSVTGATNTCAGVYDAAFTFYASTCP